MGERKFKIWCKLERALKQKGLRVHLCARLWCRDTYVVGTAAESRELGLTAFAVKKFVFALRLTPTPFHWVSLTLSLC
jgi:hypothetical protein